MAPPRGPRPTAWVAAHEGEAIGIREAVRSSASGMRWGRPLGSRRVLVRVWLHSISHYLCICMWHHVAEPGRPPESGFLHLGLWLHNLTQPVAWVVYGLLTQQRKATAGRRWARSGYRGVDVGLHTLLLLPRTMMHG